MSSLFKLHADYKPMGDQPQAIAQLMASIQAGNRYQTLLGVTGSGKTFTMANVIAQCDRPVLIISHNKTLAAQLYSEFKNFFPENAVEYFVSYYDYYQPEAYVASSDTYIEKDSSINEEIERMRIATASSLVSRRDVIVVASVSCIYGLGSPEDFQSMRIALRKGEALGRNVLLQKLVDVLYERNDYELKRGSFRVRGDVVDIMPAYLELGLRVEFWGEEIEALSEFDPTTGTVTRALDQFDLYPATQYVASKDKLAGAIQAIKTELDERVAVFEKNGQLLEAQRIRMRTNYDLEMLQEMGFCNGIENYSSVIAGRKPGERPVCLVDFFPKDALLMIDESHVSIPQIGGMSNGDKARKMNLVNFGFRLPSALDNRPQTFAEFLSITGQTLFVSATPAPYELEKSAVIAEQVIRPTGLLDPEIVIHSTKGQVEHLIGEINRAVEKGERVLVTTLTKRLSEDITSFMREAKIRVEYLHSDIDAIERVEILRNLRLGNFDVLVGINLLREGLDLPEVALVAILDADKEGFLRSETSLIQTAGRAARHENGRVIFYADKITESIRRTQEITSARRAKQIAYNLEHGITPRSTKRTAQSSLHVYDGSGKTEDAALAAEGGEEDVKAVIAELEEDMTAAAGRLEFERAALLRDQIEALKSGDYRKAAQTASKGRAYPKAKRRR
ncbi:MAG: excinuclease ABC subunit UvrB [Opitutus sp.]|nr:excinuclease ABC subunit UvrB [Opitutus sp.]MCS6247724.1 excinuclease ABC subunit UvrB [Opitutus sp.]MCS6274632.1 excinuclease ABC subunit UvrB [Opitutus sp.]MCS6277776.1 excinuclease ABC subunit UvrB [Opitutus sp.]MCS6299118.1 excinuclease ABC subunit UvrB [Opitutus sp.]